MKLGDLFNVVKNGIVNMQDIINIPKTITENFQENYKEAMKPEEEVQEEEKK